MLETRYFKFSLELLLMPLFGILSIWTVFWLELRFGVNFNNYGIFPRRLSGLQGVLFGPFIHGSIEHLYNNTIPLAVLTLALYYFYQKSATKIMILGMLITGVFTWLIGRPSYHIGVSGVIYVLASFIFFKGIFTKYYRLIALSLAIVFIYGSMLWYIFPIEESISWEGHLSGFLTGLLLARIVKTEIPEPVKYKWERDDFNEENDEFLKHFDENGNFIENTTSSEEEKIKVVYHIKRPKSDN